MSDPKQQDWFQQILTLGIGTTSLMAEKLREASDQWVKDGKIDSDRAQEFVDDLVERMRSEQGNFEEQMERQVRNFMQDFGVARQQEVDELRGRIDRLERKLRDLENRNWR